MLWEQVRMRGGAYGVFASPNGGEGVFTFASYRDPRTIETLEAYRSGLEHLSARFVDSSELEKAIIGVVGRDVRPMAPSEKSIVGFRRRLYNISDELRQKKRDCVVSASPRDIGEAAERLRTQMERSVSVVMAGKQAIDRAAETDASLGARRKALPL